MTNQFRELSIDELGTVSGGDLGSMSSLVALESARLEGEKQSTVASNQASGVRQTPVVRQATLAATYSPIRL